MTPEEKILINKILEKTEENNKMLRSVTRSIKISRIISIIYWIFIIGSAVGLYYFIQPYIEILASIYDNARSGISTGFNGFFLKQ